MFPLRLLIRSQCSICRTLAPRYQGRKYSVYDSDVEEETDGEIDEILEEQVEGRPKLLNSFHDERNVFVIQPRSKWGPQKTETMSRTSAKLQLEEAVSLIKTLKNWKVVEEEIMNTTNINQPYFFGEGKLEEISERIAKNREVNTVFLSVNKMHGWQQYRLSERFGVEVVDRFSVVLQIFNNHARSKEGKLQVALAEIPYIRSRLRQMTRTERGRERRERSVDLCGSGETFYQLRLRLLEEREMKLKKALQKLRENRDRLRSRRVLKKIPTVSVVGYTNSGKTSLIRSLTDDTSLEPRNELFATLDVTVHGGRIGSLSQVLFVDTVGFICDIPSSLIEAFNATLREVTHSDLVVHIHDVSNPDLKNQRLTVDRTLNQDLKIGSKLDSTMIHVGNKVDKLTDPSTAPSGCDLLVSATEGTNMEELKKEIEKRLRMNMASFQCDVRIEMGSSEYTWLCQNCSIFSHQVDETDHNYIIMTVGFNETTFGKFKKIFGHNFFIRKENFSTAQRYKL